MLIHPLMALAANPPLGLVPGSTLDQAWAKLGMTPGPDPALAVVLGVLLLRFALHLVIWIRYGRRAA